MKSHGLWVVLWKGSRMTTHIPYVICAVSQDVNIGETVVVLS